MSTSDIDAYSSEEWNEEFVEGQRKKKELRVEEYAERESGFRVDTFRGRIYDPECSMDNIS